MDNSKLALSVTAANYYGNPSDDIQLVGVTGTNGKTTTVNLLFEMCNIKELEPILGGNIGIAFSGLVLNDLQNKISKINEGTRRGMVVEIIALLNDEFFTYHFNQEEPILNIK